MYPSHSILHHPDPLFVPSLFNFFFFFSISFLLLNYMGLVTAFLCSPFFIRTMLGWGGNIGNHHLEVSSKKLNFFGDFNFVRLYSGRETK